MTTPYTRKKQPDLIRRTLLECAAKLAIERGVAGITIQAVADAAGVTKGGLFHHFPNKQALVEGVFVDLLHQLDSAIDARMQEDEESYGSFTRAYVEVTFEEFELGKTGPAAAITLSMLAEPTLARRLEDWLQDRARRHSETDPGPIMPIIRFAADGMWLLHALRATGAPSPIPLSLRNELVAMTRAR